MQNEEQDLHIIPVLIGADLNCYHVARAFYEAYGVESYAFGRYAIGATMHSKFIRFTTVENLDTDAIFLKTVNAFAKAHANKNDRLIIIGCTDDYVNLIARHRDALSDRFAVPYNDIALMDEYASKERFYQNCDKHGIAYPKTKIVHTGDTVTEEACTPEALGFSYPMIVKPANSITYWKHPFDGMNKVYVSDSPKRTAEIIQTIFESGYDDSIILQDMIPGNDSGMYVLTAYCSKEKKVEMMCLGHVLLEEHTPKGRGNHAAIITEYKPALMEKFKTFLEDIGYVGFANFDIKYDPRDDSYRAFEVNLRQGRSNYYVTAAGANIAACIVDDYIYDKHPATCRMIDNQVLWTFIPKGVIYKYTHNDTFVSAAKALVKSKKYHHSLWYTKDLSGNPKRFKYVFFHELNHYKKFKTYCK